jgi:hypothetical protein
MKFSSAFAILLLVAVGCSEKSETTVSASTTTANVKAVAAPASTTKEQAVALIFELPEIKAWSRYIESTTGGKVHASIMVLPEEPRNIDGKQYWSVNFYENQTTHMSRWESFLVSLDSKEIMVDDIADDVISLQEWRTKKKPMERIRGANAP